MSTAVHLPASAPAQSLPARELVAFTLASQRAVTAERGGRWRWSSTCS
ncbi:hypothetical protein [Kitasatospora sp. NBC_00315]